MRLGVLISGRGSNLAALLEARASGQLPEAEFAVVVCNVPSAPGIRVATDHAVPCRVIDHRDFTDRPAHEKAILAALRDAGCAAVVLAGYRRLLGPTLLDAFPGAILNIHPSLLPAFPGLHAQERALRAGVPVSGCTVHFVDAGLDSGPIVAQRAVVVEPLDTVDSLSERILSQEHQLLVEVVDRLTRGDLRPHQSAPG